MAPARGNPMAKVLVFAILAALAATPALATGESPARQVGVVTAPIDVERQALAEAQSKFNNNDNSSAQTLLTAVVASPSFGALNSDERHQALYMLSWLRVNSSDYKSAQAVTKAATALDEATGNDWHLRLATAAGLADDDDAMLSVTTIARRWPTTLDQVNDRFILQLAVRTRTTQDLADRRFELLAALNQARWKPQDPVLTSDFLWGDLTLALLERGRVQQARAVAENVASPDLLMWMRIDKRFDAIVQSDLDRYDIPRAAAHDLARMQKVAAANPDSLEAINELATTLIAMNRSAEALPLLDAAITRARPADRSKSPFKDTDELNWTFNARAGALFTLGRSDEAITQMQAGARRPENGDVNVSQQLNLGEYYERLGRAKEAIETVRDVGPENVSNYGAMDAEGVRACAYTQLNDGAKLEASLKYMTAHAAVAPGWVVTAMLCANNLSAAAEQVVAQLKDPMTREATLMMLQDAVVPAGTPAPVREQHRRLLAVRDRPEVRQAIDAVGRIKAYPLVASDL
jgi:tetratricopeptide (TPR) repeat protein